MNKRTIIFAVITLVIGIVVGGWSVAIIYKHRTDQLIADYKYYENGVAIGSLTSDADIKVFELRRLRAGDTTNVIQDEESHLEIDLISLESFVADSNEIRNYPPYIDALQDVKNYRTEFPYKEASSIHQGIAEVFSLLNNSTNH